MDYYCCPDTSYTNWILEYFWFSNLHYFLIMWPHVAIPTVLYSWTFFTHCTFIFWPDIVTWVRFRFTNISYTKKVYIAILCAWQMFMNVIQWVWQYEVTRPESYIDLYISKFTKKNKIIIPKGKLCMML